MGKDRWGRIGQQALLGTLLILAGGTAAAAAEEVAPSRLQAIASVGEITDSTAFEGRLRVPEPGDYAVEASSDLETWNEIDSTSTPGDEVTVHDEHAGQHRKRFYRARQLGADDGVRDQSTLWVDGQSGNDEEARAGDPDRPFETLAAALEAVESGQNVAVANGTYEVSPAVTSTDVGEPEAPLVLADKEDVVIQGIGNAVRIQGEGPGDFLNIENCRNIRIENLSFVGNRPDAGGEEGNLYAMILLRKQNQHVKIRDCRFQDYGNHGISHLWGPKTSTFVTVESCSFENGGDADVPGLQRDGAAVSGIGSHWTVQHNSIVDCVRGIEVEGATDEVPIRQVLIQGNHLVATRGRGIMVFSTRTSEKQYTDIAIKDNLIADTSPAGFGITADGGEQLMISGNTIRSANAGIFITTEEQNDFRDAIISHNQISDVETTGIVLWQKTGSAVIEGCKITHNIVRECDRNGIHVFGSRHSVLGNTCYNNGTTREGAGIRLENAPGPGSQYSMVSDNICYDDRDEKAQDYGIWIGSDVAHTILRNNVALDEEHAEAGFRNDGELTDSFGNKIE